MLLCRRFGKEEMTFTQGVVVVLALFAPSVDAQLDITVVDCQSKDNDYGLDF